MQPNLRYRTTFFAAFRRVSAHGAHTNMATYARLGSGSWRVQVRRKGRYVSETFLRREDARKWATDAERQVDRGETPTSSKIARLNSFADLVSRDRENAYRFRFFETGMLGDWGNRTPLLTWVIESRAAWGHPPRLGEFV